MIKNIALTLLLMGTFVFVSQAQIKRQYRDDANLASVVVVKSSADISDVDILNSNFDLANVSMGDEIRITTEMLNEMANEPETTAEVTEIEEIEPIAEVPQQMVQSVQREEEPVSKTVAQVVRPEVSRASAVSNKTVSSTTSSKRTAKFSKKKKKKRIRLKKRKNVKKRRYNRCYAF